MTVVERRHGGRGREGGAGRPAVRPGGERREWVFLMLLQFLMAYGHPHTCGLRASSQISPTMTTS